MSAEMVGREAVEAAVQAERERIALDLHDTAEQHFTLIALMLRHEVEGLPDDSRLRERLTRLAALADEGKRESRRVVAGVAFPSSGDPDLPTGLTELVDRMVQDSGLPVSLDVTGPAEAVPADVASALCRVAREALVNVWRHAHATSAAVELSCGDAQVLLRVRDDGVGRNGNGPASNGSASNGSASSGRGTVSMRRAVEALGGRLRLMTAGGSGGMLVEACVPYQPDRATAS